ncbi:MAG: permease [Clostridiaceae bacterium]|nr:permease [Clostridiaceae bacterium]
MRNFIKRYRAALVLLALNIFILIVFPVIGRKSMELTFYNAKEMLMVIPPIFILLGLLDVWVKRETMIKLMGEKSGVTGVVIAFLMGSAAAGPLYAAFPIAGMLLKKGSRLSNVLIFIGAWSTTKIPLLLFEASAMGWKFMVTRFLINLVGIGVIALIIERLLGSEEKAEIYEKAAAAN